jgi:hypothetical protein
MNGRKGPVGSVPYYKKQGFQTQERKASLVSSEQSWQPGPSKNQKLETQWTWLCEIFKGDGAPDMLLRSSYNKRLHDVCSSLRAEDPT